MPARFALAIPLWLLTGCILTLIVSWAIAAASPLIPTSCGLHHDPDRDFRKPSVGIVTYGGPGWIRRSWCHGYSSPWHNIVKDNPRVDAIVRIDARPLSWLHWGNAESARHILPSLQREQCEHATGWPLPALWYSARYPKPTGPGALLNKPPGLPGPDPIVSGGIALPLPSDPTKAGAPLSACRALPWQPIPIGIAVNTVFWAIIASGLTVGYSSIRSRFRLRRGHCPTCNYDLAGTPSNCPECGWNRSK